jgi:dephospho-CoA kinase
VPPRRRRFSSVRTRASLRSGIGAPASASPPLLAPPFPRAREPTIRDASEKVRRPSAAHVPVLGLTGAVGAGKSTLAAHLRRLGCAVLDVDGYGHEALDSEPVRSAVAREFGPGALREDGTVDRAAVARAAFADAALRRRLEGVVHPVVRRRLTAELAAARRRRPRAVVVDCALLFEGGLDVLCDATVVVDAAPAARAARLRSSRGWTADEVRRREAAQLSAEEKAARADRVIRNDADADALAADAERWLEEVAPARPRAARREAAAQERNDG